MVPMEIGLPSPRVENFKETANMVRQRADLDLLEERREAAAFRLAIYQRRVA